MSGAGSHHYVDIGRSTRWLALVAALLVTLSVTGQVVGYHTGYDGVAVRLFDLDAERNVPTFFAVVLLLIASALLGIIAAIRRRARAPDRVQWAVLSIGFFVMALDEAASIHERLIRPVRALLGDGPYGPFYYAWVLPAILLVLLLGLYFMRFLARLPADTRTRFLIAATLFLGGAIGIELAGGAFAEEHGSAALGYRLIVNVEEGFELAGSVVFIHALLSYMAQHVPAFTLRFDGALRAASPPGEVAPLPVRRYG